MRRAVRHHRFVPSSPIVAAACVLLFGPLPARAVEEPLVPASRKPRVEVVFALDTTGSMSGLIDGAKRKIWSIVNEVQKAQQKPEVRLGVVAYRDRGDAYVTQTIPLSDDIDSVYAQLMRLSADGGGDEPEDVNAALHEAVNNMAWSEGKDVLKLVFLVGDAEPHMDYAQAPRWQTITHAAVRKNIYVNTVQCGASPATTAAWQAIARAAEGRFAAIPQDGGVVAIATPYDDDLARLSSELDRTYLDYGSKAKRDEAKISRTSAADSAASYGAATAGSRAAAKMSAAPRAKDDFIDLVKAKGGAGAALAGVADDELPDELRGKSKDEQAKAVEGLATRRAQLSVQIADLAKKRDAHVAAEMKKRGGADGFDKEVVEAIQHEARAVGLTY